MNELAVKKRAEVAAFISTASAIASRAGRPLADHAPDCYQALHAIAGLSVDSNLDSADRELYQSKTAKTIQKLTSMMELYIGDDWDDPIEVLEWCSFYAGAGAAHCAIAGHLAATANTSDAAIAAHLSQMEGDFRQLLDLVIGRLARP
jgi:hypothetical protein